MVKVSLLKSKVIDLRTIKFADGKANRVATLSLSCRIFLYPQGVTRDDIAILLTLKWIE